VILLKVCEVVLSIVDVLTQLGLHMQELLLAILIVNLLEST